MNTNDKSEIEYIQYDHFNQVFSLDLESVTIYQIIYKSNPLPMTFTSIANQKYDVVGTFFSGRNWKHFMDERDATNKKILFLIIFFIIFSNEQEGN